MALTHTYIIRNRIPPISIVHHPPARNFDRLAARKIASMVQYAPINNIVRTRDTPLLCR